MVASEPLQCNDQYRRDVVNLYLFNSLFMIQTSITVPSIRLRQFFRSVELSKAIIDTDPFSQFLVRVGFTVAAILGLVVVDESVQACVQSPAFLMVELYEELKFEVFRLLDKSWICFASCTIFGAFACLFNFFLVFQGCFSLFLIRLLCWLAVFLIVKMRR